MPSQVLHLEAVTEELPDASGKIHKVRSDIATKDSQSVRDQFTIMWVLADLSDSAFLTTMARILHIPWLHHWK